MFERRVGLQSSGHHGVRGTSLLLCAALVLVGPACRKPQEGGERRPAPDSGIAEFSPKIPKSCDELLCAAPAECKVSGGRASCVCPSGYKEVADAPGTCEDIDECATQANDCDANAACKNRIGSYECACNEGFSGTGRICQSLNDCEGIANTCHADATCTNSDDAAQCMCSTGFEGDGHVCMDIDECEQGTAECGEHAHCVNVRANYDCACDAGYEGDGHFCEDLCDRAQRDSSRCDERAHGRCQYAADGTAKCTSCVRGWVGDGKNCTPSGECTNLNCGDNTRCVGDSGQRTCECAPGFTGDPMVGCTDVDECKTGNACNPPNSICVNRPGGYLCACGSGLERNSNGECTPVNECARGLDLCDSGANCIDLASGYTCECKAGYTDVTGNGYVCEDVDECQPDGADCVKDGVAQCVNTRGSYECQCPKGYAGDGKKENCYCDLSGVWGVRQKGTLVLPKRAAGSTVIIDESVTHATIWELHRYVYDGDSIKVQREQCGSDVVAEIYSPLYTETYSSFVPNDVYEMIGFKHVNDIPLPRSGALPGKPFVTPLDAIVQGLKMNDPVHDPWPASHRDIPDSAWEDTDNDGEPGITLWPGQTTHETRNGRGTYSYLPVQLQGDSTRIDTRTGCVSAAVRVIGHLDGMFASCSRIVGKVVNNQTEGRVHSCEVLRMADWDKLDVTCTKQDWTNARRCSTDQIEFLDDQDQTSMSYADFEIVKLGDMSATDINCDAVRKALPAFPNP